MSMDQLDRKNNQDADHETEYEIECLEDCRQVSGGKTMEYLVKWQDWPNSTWEPATNLPKEVILNFETGKNMAAKLDVDESEHKTESVMLDPLQRVLIDEDDFDAVENMDLVLPIIDNFDVKDPLAGRRVLGYESDDEETIDENSTESVHSTNVAELPALERDDESENASEENDDNEESEEYEVENIVRHRMSKVRPKTRHGKLLKEYLVKWKGWGDQFNQWMHEDNCSCPDIIERYEKNRVRRPRGRPSQQTSGAAQNENASNRKRQLPKKTMPAKKRARQAVPVNEMSVEDQWSRWTETATLRQFRAVFRNAHTNMSKRQLVNLANTLQLPF